MKLVHLKVTEVYVDKINQAMIYIKYFIKLQIEKISAYILPTCKVPFISQITSFSALVLSQNFHHSSRQWFHRCLSTRVPSIYISLLSLKFLVEIINYEKHLPNQWNLSQKSLQHFTITFSELFNN